MAVDHLRQRRHPVARDLGAVLLVRVQFEKFNETYGSLGAVIGFMWISAIVILLGAELDAEMEHQTARDTTTGSPKPMGCGARGWPIRTVRRRATDMTNSAEDSDLGDEENSSPSSKRLTGAPASWTLIRSCACSRLPSP